MKHIILFFVFIFIIFSFRLQSQQRNIPRIEQMPDIPSLFQLKDWKKTTVDYDNFVFNTANAGTYLPLTSISEAAGINFPEINTIRMDTYVGQDNHGHVAEAINILPAIVGASLIGVDKTSHLNTDWVIKVKDFFNSRNGQNIYLNNYSANSGNDWWYETMPNVFFMQLHSLYPYIDSDFDKQIITIADRQLEVISKLGGTYFPWSAPDMNHRAFNLITGTPNSSGVPEPEAAGAIAWMLYQAYLETDNMKYKEGAELSLSFLQNWNRNPSYEIQLPYGIVAAARMNAIEQTNFDLDKMLNWTFSSGIGTLRGWGCIAGNWNGYEMSGLIGEANDGGNDYAFLMNGFQHAAALAPVAKYDKRYARAIAKWILNLANASRFFYRDELPASLQHTQSYEWSVQYDTNACIPYESIKERWNGTSPFAMGDAVNGGWAATNLSLYSGSSVGYLAALIEPTNIQGILQIDLNRTDFRSENTSPVYLYYNPFAEQKNIQLTLPEGNYNIYDAVSESVIITNASGTVNFDISPDNIRMLVVYPAENEPEANGRYFKLPDGEIIDYHYHYNYGNGIRIRTFNTDKEIVSEGETVIFNCQVQNYSAYIHYKWYVNDEMVQATTTNTYRWVAPESPGDYKIYCVGEDLSSTITSHEITIKVVPAGTVSPEIEEITFNRNEPFNLASGISVSALLNTTVNNIHWECTGGVLHNEETLTPLWTLPDEDGVYQITLSVENELGSSVAGKTALVKNLQAAQYPSPLIYYPFNGDTKNHAADKLHAVSVNALPAEDARGYQNQAYRFTNSNEYIYTPHSGELDFTENVAISCWINPGQLPAYEQFILSHGSWEERYKLSVTPERNLRWTLKTTTGTIDVDDPQALVPNEFVHYTAQYTGYSLELYRNGMLTAYKPLSGNIGTTDRSITIARKDENTSEYTFAGIIDEIRIYDVDLSPSLIANLPSIWELIVSDNPSIISDEMLVYPNPFTSGFQITFSDTMQKYSLRLVDIMGKEVWSKQVVGQGEFLQPAISLNKGIYLLIVELNSGERITTKLIKQ